MRSAPNLVLAIITGFVVIVAVVAAIFAARDTAPNWPADSPEAVVQDYVQAIIDQNYADAITHLDPALECTTDHFVQAYYPQDTSIALVQAHITQNQATVTVELGSYSEPFFDPFIGQERFELVTTADDTWQITGAPWPVYDCVGTL